MKIYQVHAYSTLALQNYQCRAIRGDGTIFWVHITRNVFSDGKDVAMLFAALMDDLGQASSRGLYRSEVPKPTHNPLDPNLGLWIFGSTPTRTSASDTEAPWRSLAKADALDLLRKVTKSVELSDNVCLSETAQVHFRFKKTGERKAVVR